MKVIFLKDCFFFDYFCLCFGLHLWITQNNTFGPLRDSHETSDIQYSQGAYWNLTSCEVKANKADADSPPEGPYLETALSSTSSSSTSPSASKTIAPPKSCLRTRVCVESHRVPTHALPRGFLSDKLITRPPPTLGVVCLWSQSSTTLELLCRVVLVLWHTWPTTLCVCVRFR